MKPMKLEGKIAIVTGCNGEFGLGHRARPCSPRAADVACVDFKQADADAAAEKYGKNRRALAIAIDLRKRQEIEAMVKQVVDAFGRIDILGQLHHGVAQPEFLNFKEEDFDDSLSRGVKSYFHPARLSRVRWSNSATVKSST